MFEYIALNGRQPDNEFFYRQKKRMFYRSYAGELSRQANFQSGIYGQQNQSNSFLVLNGLNRLLSQRAHSSLASKKVENEAQQYWDRQRRIEEIQRKKDQEQEYDYEIDL